MSFLLGSKAKRGSFSLVILQESVMGTLRYIFVTVIVGLIRRSLYAIFRR